MNGPVQYLRHLASGEFGNVGWRMNTFSANGKVKLRSLFANAAEKLKRANNNAIKRMVEQNFMEKYRALKNHENAKYTRELANLEAAIAEARFNREMKALVNATARSIKARPKRGTTKPPRPPMRSSARRPSPGSAMRRKALQRNIRQAESVLARHQR
jgi:hypothetical protein